MSEALTQQLEGSLLITESETSLVLMPTMNLQIAKQRMREFQDFVQEYLHEGEDYGIIPGTPKPTLYKPGADKLCELYGLSDSYIILAKVEDFEKGLFDYTIECQLVSRRTNQFVSSGLGCCSSWESKYRWREEKRKCPSCGKDTIIKGKAEYGGGWVCFKKKDGCGAKFPDNHPSIMEQAIGRVENPDIIDQKNTVLKMAKKRAKIDATLSATRSSGVFTQDMEDLKPSVPSDAEFDEEIKRTPAQQKVFAAAKVEAMKKQAPQNTGGDCPECQGSNGAHKWGCPNLKRPEAARSGILISKADNIALQTARKKSGIPDADYYTVLEAMAGVSHGPDIPKEHFEAVLKQVSNYPN